MSPSTPPRRPSGARPNGQRSLATRRRLPAEVYRRRRLTVLSLAVVVVVLFIVGIVLLAQALTGGGADRTAQPGDAGQPADDPTSQAAPGPEGDEASGNCPHGAVSVMAKTNKDSYKPGETAKLQLTVKNGNSKDCSIEVGSEAQNYVVQKDGKTVWASKFCADGGPSDVKTFAAGAEKKATVSWDMVPADNTCKKTADQLEPGDYQLITQLGDVKSEPVTFKVEDDEKSSDEKSGSAKPSAGADAKSTAQATNQN